MVYFVFTGKSTLSRERDVIFTQDGSFLAITPFQSLLESRYFHGRKRFPFLIGWVDCKPRPVKLPKCFVKPPFYLLALLALAQRTNGERLTYGNTKENMGAVE